MAVVRLDGILHHVQNYAPYDFLAKLYGKGTHTVEFVFTCKAPRPKSSGPESPCRKGANRLQAVHASLPYSRPNRMLRPGTPSEQVSRRD